MQDHELEPGAPQSGESTLEVDFNDLLSGTSRANRQVGATGFESNSVVIGQVVSLDKDGSPFVDHPFNHVDAPLPARSLVSVTTADIGREAALMFENGDATKPILMGLVHQHTDSEPFVSKVSDAARPLDVKADDERITLTANKEIVLRCGKASITLTKSGKVLIRGAYLSSRSSGVNRIKGGSIQLN